MQIGDVIIEVREEWWKEEKEKGEGEEEKEAGKPR